MNAADWIAWISYELEVAAAAFVNTIVSFRRPFGVTRKGLESWVGLLLLAFSAALSLGHWLGANYFAALIAFGLASAIIVGAAVNAVYEMGLKDRGTLRETKAESSSDHSNSVRL